MLEIKNLSKIFADVVVLDNINISIKKTSIVGLAGSSGSGKSTLLRLIQKLEVFEHGVIECHARKGFMFQDFQLFPHMTVLENVIYGPRINNKHDYQARVVTVLRDLGLTSKMNNYPCELSGGQKQRVALARSLMMEPEILLCDEPTSGLDVATIYDVVMLLKSVRERGVTMIIASHDLDFLTEISDRIVLLKNGKIVVDVDLSMIQNPIGYLKNFY